jgi:hypothetical protein
MSLNFSVKAVIEKKIKEIADEYKKTKGLILTEDDLKCLLYRKLMKIPELSSPKATKNPSILANSIHTEVSWYDKNKKLTIKPDITILEPKNLSILHGCYDYEARLPSKGFEFYGKAILFELKFIRNKTGIRKATVESNIKKDFEKIKKLFHRLDSQYKPYEIFCYFIIFNKTNIKCPEFEHFLRQNEESDRHKIIYKTGDVEFSRVLGN